MQHIAKGSIKEDEDYQPTQDDVIEYAKFLGMDVDTDKDLFYIAEEGVSKEIQILILLFQLRAPVPAPWNIIEQGEQIFYHNSETQQVMNDHPMD